MKKLITITTAFLMSCAAMSVTASAAESEPVSVSVTISDSEGKLALVQEKVSVTDIDGDGALTINDALYLAHEDKFEGGADAGYNSEQTQYGLSMTKLWGTENGGAYGYYLNDSYVMGLATEVKDGDSVNAYIYTDLETYSDTYCYFDVKSAEAVQGDELALTLSYIGFDENYAPVALPAAGAEITVNGKGTGVVTDKSGKASVKLEEAGSLIISAKSATQTLVPPVCTVNAAADPSVTSTTTTTETTTSTTSAAAGTSSSPSTGDKGMTAVFAVLGVSAAAAFVLRKNEE